jgi:hypothetical protein
MRHLLCKPSATVRFTCAVSSLRGLRVQVRMANSEHVKTVVFGGKLDVPAQYCGTVGGQSAD